MSFVRLLLVFLTFHMEEVAKIWQDGGFVDWHDCKTHVLTHTLHYGAGVFEGIRFYKTDKGSAVFKLKEHIERLFYSARIIEMEIPFSVEELMKAVIDTINVNDVDSGYIRPLAYFGYGKMGLNPAGADINVVVAIWPWGSYLGDSPISVKVSNYIRIHPKSLVTDAKVCGHYVNSILASQEVHKLGYDESLFLDYEGNVAEGPGENLFLVKDEILYTPAKGSILPGITRDSIMKIAKDEFGISSIEKTLKVEDVYSADEAFFTGTAAEVTSIASVNDKKIGDGKVGVITSKLKDYYLGIVRGNKEKYLDWLSFCTLS